MFGFKTYINMYCSRNWQVVGEQHPRLLRSISSTGHLYHCQIRSRSHKLKVEEIKNFEQDDLSDDDIMILDGDDTVFVWIGKGASDEEKAKGPKYAHVSITWNANSV